MKRTTFLAVVSIVLTSSSLMAESSDEVLFSFKKDDEAKQWQAVNDGVMGGRSDGRFRITESDSMEFYGTLSLANNGGFASVRSRGANLGLAEAGSIVARVRGDGRDYSLNLYTPVRRTAYSYRSNFKTKKNEWVEVRLPLEEFTATWFGRALPNQVLDPTEVNGIGILIGDKQAGPFKLEIDWIKVTKPSK